MRYLSLTFLTFCLASTIAYSQNPDFNKLYQRANESINKQNYPAAIIYLDSALTLNSKVDSIYSVKAFCLSMLGLYDKALDNCNSAIAINPINDFAYFIRGFSKSQIDVYEQVIDEIFKPEYLNDSIKLKELRLKYNIVHSGKYSIQVFDIGSAINDVAKAIELNPNHAEYYNQRAKFYENISLFDKSIDDYDAAISLNPNDPYYYFDRALIFKSVKKSEQALNDFNKAIQLKPDDKFFFANRGYLKFEQLKDNKGACEDLTKAQMLGLFIDDLSTYCK